MATDSNQQRENIRLQNEYNEAMKMSQSISGALIKDLDEQIDKRTTIGKKVKDYIKDLQSSISKLETSDDIQKKIVDNESEISKIQKSHFGANKKVGDEKIKALKLTNDSLRIEGDRLQLIEKVDAEAQNLAQSLGSSLDGLIGSLDDIPLIGSALARVGNIGASAIKDQLGNAAMKFTTTFASGLRSGMGTMQALGAAGSTAGSLLTAALASPLVIIGLIAAGLALGFKRFQELEKAAANFRAETGLLNSQTRQLQTNIQQVSGTMAGLGVSAEDVSKAASDFTNEFQGLEQPSKSVLTSMVALNKNFGIGTQEASKLNKVFQNIGGLTATQSQALIGQTVEMAKMAGVAPSKVVKDMADNSEVAYQFFGGSVKELAAAAVEAAAMGTSIAEAGKAARGLLDYQSSVSKELEASAILGTNINLSQARYLAANGDIVGSQQAILDSVSHLGDLTKLNVYEQEALAEATGMEFSSLVNQQRIREKFGKLKKEELAAAQSLLDSGKDLSNLTKADLDAQNQRLKGQQELQSQTSRFSNAMSGIGTAFMDMLAPIADFLMPILADIGEVLNNVISPIFRFIGSVIGATLAPLGFVLDVIFAIIKPLSQVVGLVWDGLAKPFNYIIELFNGFGSIISDMGMWFNEYLIEPLTRAYEIGSSIASTLTFGLVGSSDDESGTSVTSVNDAVISPSGDIISTHPDDFLIATKTPETLGGGSGAVNLSGVISELKSLREAFVSNKDVYIDGDRVTAKVTMRQESSGKNQFGMSGA